MGGVSLRGRFVLVNATRVVVYLPLNGIDRTINLYIMKVYCYVILISIF